MKGVSPGVPTGSGEFSSVQEAFQGVLRIFRRFQSVAAVLQGFLGVFQGGSKGLWCLTGYQVVARRFKVRLIKSQ